MVIDTNMRGEPRGAARLQPDRTRAIWRAAIIELAMVGYGRLSMDAVAKRAGVGKAALYRRWDGKEAMIIGLIAAIDLEIISGADCGSLAADIRDYLAKAAQLLRRPLASRILPDLYSEVGRDSALAQAIRTSVLARKRDSIKAILDRAIVRGELAADIDIELAFDLVVGPIYWRSLVTRSSSTDGIDPMAKAISAALRSLSN